MKRTVLFDFTVDKERKTINVKREFAADPELVWKAWTTAELLDQWWAPEPYKAITKSMNFIEGGRWHYHMLGPNGEKHWCCLDYKEINKLKNFSALDAFCDESGNINTSFPRSRWNNGFSGNGEITTVSINITFDDLADLEKIIEMGFKEGFSKGLQNLEDLLGNMNQKQI